ncbi:MAG: 2-oxoacid:acceptor oxidoreductase family protein [Coriobacteriia bacterium]|nr:2-oxoacid:acceptor oxidoreductase family protein [Coriobacteriia bacterium]
MSEIVIAGVGGQGTVLASKLLAKAALLEGHAVRTAETIGMAQRGGTVLGHVRIARENNYGGARTGSHSDLPLSPLVSAQSADLLIGFEPGETVRALPFVRNGGAVVTAMQTLVPAGAAASSIVQGYNGAAELAYLQGCQTTGRLGSLMVVDGVAACSRLGSFKALNVLLLGAALATGSIELSEQALLAAIDALVKPQFRELNKQALAQGMSLLAAQGDLEETRS